MLVKRKRIRLAFHARAVRIRNGPRQILRVGPCPDSAEIGFTVRKTGRRRLHIGFALQRLRGRHSTERDRKCDQTQSVSHDGLLLLVPCGLCGV